MPFEFVNINFLWLLNLIPLCIAWYVWKHRGQQPSIQLSSTYTLRRESFFSLTTLQHSLGTKTDNTLYGWGNNTNSQLGDGTTDSSYNPKRI